LHVEVPDEFVDLGERQFIGGFHEQDGLGSLFKLACGF
jgi:hypothetical protein